MDEKSRVENCQLPAVCPCLEDLGVEAQPLAQPKLHKPMKRVREKVGAVIMLKQ